MPNKVTVEQRIHPVWLEIEAVKLPWLSSRGPIMGKWQYIYSSPKGKISLVELPNYFMDGITFWEIYSLEGDLFEDIERFLSKEEAEAKIMEYLQ